MKSLLKTILILGFISVPFIVLAVPGIPHQFYGTVSFENGDAPDGITVEVKVDGNVVGSSLTKDGLYGYSPSLLLATKSNGDWNGEVATFYVAGIDTEQTFSLSKNGYTNLDLTVSGIIGTIEETNENAVIEDETVVVAPTQPTNIKLGDSLNINVSSATNTSAVVNEIKKLTSSFFTGSAAVIAGNNLLNAFEINITGNDLTISVTISYDDTGIDESTIMPYRFNGTSWVVITPYTLNQSANTITFNVSSAETPYAVFGEEPAPTPPPTGGGGGGGTPTPTTYKTGDTDQSGAVDIFDFNLLMINWGNNPANAVADLDGNGKVDISDFNLLMINWG